ncbi:MAG: DUF6129 family protein [Gammaproteobacteria bacterium]
MLETRLVATIADQVATQILDEATVSSLRNKYPEVHFTYCLDDDIVTGKPVIEHENFNIYLIDGREHCLCLTNDYDNATGIVVAEVIDDE